MSTQMTGWNIFCLAPASVRERASSPGDDNSSINWNDEGNFNGLMDIERRITRSFDLDVTFQNDLQI